MYVGWISLCSDLLCLNRSEISETEYNPRADLSVIPRMDSSGGNYGFLFYATREEIVETWLRSSPWDLVAKITLLGEDRGLQLGLIWNTKRRASCVLLSHSLFARESSM